jgi:lipopolysaccharide export system permease protein
MGSSAWIRDGNTIMNISTPGEDGQGGGVYLYRMDSAGELASIGRADSADVGDANEWVLRNLSETFFDRQGVTTQRAERSTQSNNLSPDLAGLAVVRPDSLTGAALFRYMRYLRQNGLDTTPYAVVFWARLSSSVAVIPMCLLALPFVFGRLRSSGSGARMLVGVVIGLAYFLASRALADGGQVYGLSPGVVAWLPTIVLIIITAGALARAR